MSATRTLPPSHAIRAALKAALRASGAVTGRDVSNLNVDELTKALRAAGSDPMAIAEKALRDNGTPARQISRIMARLSGRTSAPRSGEATDVDTEIDASEDTTDMDATATEQGEHNMSVALSDQDTAAVDAEVSAIASLITTGGFRALDDKLRELVVAARKPPVVITREREVVKTVYTDPNNAPVHVAEQTKVTKTWRELFGVSGQMSDRVVHMWDGSHPDTPCVDRHYVFPDAATRIALSQIARKRNVYFWGAPGTGKTEWTEQLAAKLGRPYALISCDDSTDGPTLTGMTVPREGGGTVWRDGQLTRAIRTPGCVICIDEPSVARPGALFVLQHTLAHRTLFIAETGARVPVAPGVIFIATDNTNGTGGGGRRGFTGTNRLNAAFLDRFGVRLKFEYLPAAIERRVMMARTGCSRDLADLLIKCANTTRASAADQQLTAGISLRRLLSWAELLTDGIDPEEAFMTAVLHCASEDDQETLRQQCLLAYDRSAVAAALGQNGMDHLTAGNNPPPPPPSLPSAAAADFDPIDC